MTNLNGFYLDQYALNFLAQLILVLAVLLYFFRIGNKSRESWPVGLFFMAIAGNIAFNFGEATAVWSRQFYAAHFRYVILYLTLFAAVHSAYRFPFIENEPFTRHIKRELPVASFLILLALALTFFWAIDQAGQLKTGGMLDPRNRLLAIGVAVSLLWSFVTTCRRLYFLAGQTSPRRWGWRHLPAVRQRPVRALYELMGVTLFAVFLSVAMMLSTIGLLPDWILEIAPTIGIIILLFLLSISFITATLGKTSFILRLIGPVLLIIFLTLGLAGIIIANRYSESIEVRPALIEPQSLHFEPQTAESYRVDSAVLALDQDWGTETAVHEMISLPFDFPFFGRRWTEVALNEAGVVAFGSPAGDLYTYNYQPALAPYQQQEPQAWRTFVKLEAERATITWQDETAENQVVQVVLYEDGRFDYHYSGLDGLNLRRIGFQSGSGGTVFTPFSPNSDLSGRVIGGDGLWTDYQILHHQALHPLMIPLAYLIIGASLLGIFGFPWLFRSILIKPLNALVQGVQAVEAGDLAVQVPVYSDDEFGLVTEAFNQMVQTVQESEQMLEARVEERTQALAESERRLGALEERERIGRELHDDLGQVMGYVRLQVDTALTRLRRKEEDQAEQILDEVGRITQDAHDNVRQFILGIRSDKKTRPRVTFWQALRDYLALAGGRYDFEIELTGMAELETALKLEPAVETQLLRIIQEGIANVHKHAEATLVQVGLSQQGKWLQLLLMDNGRGFDPESGLPLEQGHFGLQIMQERAESVNGHFRIISQPGEGTQIQVRVPCLLDITPVSEVRQVSWRVLLVDDHALFREGLANMLRPHGIQIVGVAENGREGERLAAEIQPDLILMDIHMPEQDGLETTRRIKELFPWVKIVMLTMAVEDSLLVQALQYGASGYLLKSLPAPQFLTLLNEVMAGKTIISPDLASQVLTALVQKGDPSSAGGTENFSELLTERQQEVLSCLAQGMSNKQIAEQLYVSESTVKYHVRQIMERLGLQTRHELIRYELDNQR